MQESVPRDTRRLGLLPLHTAPNLHFTCTLCLHSPGDSDHPLTCPNPSPLLVHRVLLLLCSGCPKPTMKSESLASYLLTWLSSGSFQPLSRDSMEQRLGLEGSAMALIASIIPSSPSEPHTVLVHHWPSGMMASPFGVILSPWVTGPAS